MNTKLERWKRLRVARHAVWSLALLTQALACSQQPGDTPGSGSMPAASGPNTSPGANDMTQPPAAVAGAVGGGSPIAPASGMSPPTSPAGGAKPERLALPGDVCKVLQANGCVGCHQASLQGGAQMPLQWQSDFGAMAKDGTPLAAKVLARIQDQAAPMPPVTTMRPMMDRAQRGILQRWIDGGMGGDHGSACEPGGEPVDTLPDWATQAWPEDECEYVLTVGAHGVSGTPLVMDDSPFLTEETETNYHCFYEAVPWGDTPVQALATRVRLEGRDDLAVVHHLVVSAIDAKTGSTLFGSELPTASGEHHPCANQTGSTVGVWAPGAQNPVTMPDEAGLHMPSGEGAFIEVQVHYNNAKAGQESRLQYDICATSKLRPNTAGVHWLGFENAALGLLGTLSPELAPALDNQGNGVAMGHCSAKSRARVLWVAPHMHDRGRHAKVEIERADGSTQLLHEGPFNYMEQTAYFQKDVWLEQGESIRSTCSWDPGRRIVFGRATDEEMCFVFTLAYPMGALAGQGAELGVIGGPMNCAGSE